MDSVFRESLGLLRNQFVGLNRILSTLAELVADAADLPTESSIIEFATGLLIQNHNFQHLTLHLYDDDQLKLVRACSTNSLLRGNVDETAEAWVNTCSILASRHSEGESQKIIRREVAGEYYYSLVLQQNEFCLGYLVVNAPSLDDNHVKFLPIFANMMVSLVLNRRQQRKLAEDVHQRSVELESAWALANQSDEARMTFLTNVSHEYLTPLNVINNAGSFLLDTGLNAEQKEAVQTILNSSGQLVNMIGGTLEYVQSETGGLENHVSKVSLPDLLQETVDQITTSYVKPAVAIRLKADETPLVEVDPNRLRQILMHLMTNAMKFTDSGEVQLDLKLNKVSGRVAEVEFRVSDTGIGIAATDLEQIFSAFHQLNTSSTRPYAGTGLGLALCQRIAQSLGTSIQVSSVEGQGSTFYFALQLPIAVTIDRARIDAELIPLGVSVLLVEDNIINQKLAARLLEKMGCEVDIANDGVDAVDMFRRAKYDIVFMDCQMPNMDGFEATTRIRELESDHRTPIIALTANSLPEDRARSFRVGMDEFLTKPVARDKLKQAVTRWSPA